MTIFKFLCAVGLFIVFIPPAVAQIGPGQFHVANRLVSANEKDSSEVTVNNWLDVDYRYSGWTAGIRVEIHQPKNAMVYNDGVTQRYLEYQHDWLKVRAGHFYERLGRGVVFHAFEIQSQTLDRVQRNVAIDRNLDGVNAKVSLTNLEITGIWGTPRQMLSSRRGDPLGGGEIKLRPFTSWMFGGTYLRMDTQDFLRRAYDLNLYSFQTGLNAGAIDLFAELARKSSSQTQYEKNGEAVYVSANFSGDWLGVSAEFKRYENFAQPFNNPPALVKTHSFTLLNRHTHTLNANDEMGYQLESYVSPSPATTLTFHASGADNLARERRRRFREFFVESRNEWSGKLTSRVLIDQSEDRAIGDLRRRTAAAEIDFLLDEKNSILIDGQTQQVKHNLRGKYWNHLALLSFSRSPWLTLSLQSDWTTDRFSPRQNWVNSLAALKFAEKIDVWLTYGARPAGLLCSGGICIYVPEFKGAELRINFRL
jgi:hypothetical protein